MSQPKRHRTWSPQKKLELVLESLQSDRQVAEICRREGLAESKLYEWRKQLLASAGTVFADRRGHQSTEDPQITRLATDNQRLKNVIAEITAENLVLKKTLPE